MNKELRLIEDYFYDRISSTELNERLPRICDHDFLQNLIIECKSHKLKSSLEYVFYTKATICKKEVEFSAKLYAELLLEDWHIMHENFASKLQDLKSGDSFVINTLYAVSKRKLEYLEYNNSEALARKCIYALGAIDTEESKEKLVELTNTDDVSVRDLAIHQLKNRGYSELIPI